MMFIQLFEDLRFVIGLFFGIVSVILLAAGSGTAPAAGDMNLNFYSGLGMGLFSVVMLGMALHFHRKA